MGTMSDVETGNKAPATSEASKRKQIGIGGTIVVLAIIALGLGLGLGLPNSNFQKQKALNAVPEQYHDEGYDDDALTTVDVPAIFAAHQQGENHTVAAANATTVEDHSAGIVNPTVSWTEDHAIPDHSEFAKSEDSLLEDMVAANADGTMTTTNTTDALPGGYHDEEYDDDTLTTVDVAAVFAAHHANGTAKVVADDEDEDAAPSADDNYSHDDYDDDAKAVDKDAADEAPSADEVAKP